MSTDRLTEIVNYLSAISREIGEFRAEVNARLSEVEARLERVERELRTQGRRLDRIEGLVLTTRGEVADLEDRVVALESKQA